MLDKKTALVTGAGKGIGAGIARALAEAGAKVAIADIDYDLAKATSERLNADGFDTIAVKMDVTDEEDIERAYKKVEDAFGQFDILVNNAGICVFCDALHVDDAQWDKMLNVNLKALFSCSRIFALHRQEKGGGGAIINISSNNAKVSVESCAVYSATKAAVANLTHTLAIEFAPMGINVNAVCPGMVDTDMMRNAMLTFIANSPEPKPTLEAVIPYFAPRQLGRLIQPVEVGRVVAFLASEAALIIRGQAISVDAGHTPV